VLTLLKLLCVVALGGKFLPVRNLLLLVLGLTGVLQSIRFGFNISSVGLRLNRSRLGVQRELCSLATALFLLFTCSMYRKIMSKTAIPSAPANQSSSWSTAQRYQACLPRGRILSRKMLQSYENTVTIVPKSGIIIAINHRKTSSALKRSSGSWPHLQRFQFVVDFNLATSRIDVRHVKPLS